jgi:hypothetical protein
MDTLYEKPTRTVSPPPTGEGEDDGNSSSEEGMPDWTKLPFVRHTISDTETVPTLLPMKIASGGGPKVRIPKRGEKDFEPAGSRLQDYTLSQSREAMVDALKGVRGTSRCLLKPVPKMFD